MSNKLVDEAKEAYEKINFRNEPGITEANVTFFFVLMLTASMTFLTVALCDKLAVWGSITIASVSMVAVLVLFGIGRAHNKKILYYLCYVLSAICIAFSCCAALKHYGFKPDWIHTFYFAGVFAGFALIDLLIMAVGKYERWLMLVMLGIMLLTFILFAYFIWDRKIENGFVWLYWFFGIAFILLHLFGMIYVFTDKEFFAFTVLAYLLSAFLALIMALVAVSGGDGCDCGGCDCTGGGSTSSTASAINSGVKKKGRRFY